MYSWYSLDTVGHENPSCRTISETEWPMRHAPPMICPRSKAPKPGSLLMLAMVIPTTNLEQPYAVTTAPSLAHK
ncbi:hypothetical protein TNCV_4911011 [Trichonephila clavipes]|nr:hypothetical protein TNCV_4911011 [Trichonephila clavipes]